MEVQHLGPLTTDWHEADIDHVLFQESVGCFFLRVQDVYDVHVFLVFLHFSILKSVTGAARFRFGGAVKPGAWCCFLPVGLFHRILLAVWFLAQEPQKYIKDHQNTKFRSQMP